MTMKLGISRFGLVGTGGYVKNRKFTLENDGDV